jgi:hypothetical protein
MQISRMDDPRKADYLEIGGSGIFTASVDVLF